MRYTPDLATSNDRKKVTHHAAHAPIQTRFLHGAKARTDKVRLIKVPDMHTMYQTQTTSV